MGDERLRVAYQLFHRREHAEVLRLAHEALASEPRSVQALLLLGAAHFQRREFRESLQCNEMAARVDPALPEAYVNIGNVLRELDDAAGAIHFYLKAVALNAHMLDAYQNLASAYVQLGQAELAAHAYQAALALNPSAPELYCNFGNVLKHLGRVEEARLAYQAALRLRPTWALPWSGLAATLKDQGKVPDAIAAFLEAVRLDPSFADAWSNLGNAYKEAGRLADAKAAYLEAIRQRPGFAIAHGNLASCYFDEGNAHRAIEEYQHAIRLEPNFPDAFNNLGNAYREVGLLEESVQCYRTALQLKPDHAHAYNNLGNSLKDKGMVREAIHCYMTACRLLPTFAAAHSNLASILKEQGKIEAAIKCYHAALRADPAFADAYSNMGNAYKDVGRLGDAVRCYAVAIQLRPRFADAYSNLASAFKDCGRVEEAIVCYRRALELKPDFSDAFSNLVHSMLIVCDWRGRTRLLHGLFRSLRRQLAFCLPELADTPSPGTCEHSRRTVMKRLLAKPFMGVGDTAELGALAQSASSAAAQPAASAPRSGVASSPGAALPGQVLPTVQPFHSLVYPLDVREMYDIARCYAARAELTARSVPVPVPPFVHSTLRGPAERLRIGYVSSDFGNHPLSHLMQSVFGMHDKRRFEVFCFALSPSDGSTWRRKIEAEVEHFEDLTTLGFVEVARVIAERRIHILVNLNGYTKGARNEVFALRPAPIQVSYMGFCGTMGAPFMDYFVVDKTVVPPSVAPFYSERMAYLPHSYFVNDHRQSARFVMDPLLPMYRARYGIPEGRFVFANFNQVYKIDPITFAAWCRILLRVPDSILWLLRFPPAAERHVQRAARAFGVAAERIMFTDVAAKDEHIARGRLADLFLDTPMCNAHTTACDILWAGVPIVTVPGEKMASRVAASLLNAAGLGECIARSLDEYVEIAVALALDRERLRRLREQLEASRDRNPAFDTIRWTRNLETAFSMMWQAWTEEAARGSSSSQTRQSWRRRPPIEVPDCIDGRIPPAVTHIAFRRTPDERIPMADSDSEDDDSSTTGEKLTHGVAAPGRTHSTTRESEAGMDDSARQAGGGDSRAGHLASDRDHDRDPAVSGSMAVFHAVGALPPSHPETVLEAFVAAHSDSADPTPEQVAAAALVYAPPAPPPGPAAALTPGAAALPPPPIAPSLIAAATAILASSSASSSVTPIGFGGAVPPAIALPPGALPMPFVSPMAAPVPIGMPIPGAVAGTPMFAIIGPTGVSPVPVQYPIHGPTTPGPIAPAGYLPSHPMIMPAGVPYMPGMGLVQGSDAASLVVGAQPPALGAAAHPQLSIMAPPVPQLPPAMPATLTPAFLGAAMSSPSGGSGMMMMMADAATSLMVPGMGGASSGSFMHHGALSKPLEPGIDPLLSLHSLELANFLSSAAAARGGGPPISGAYNPFG